MIPKEVKIFLLNKWYQFLHLIRIVRLFSEDTSGGGNEIPFPPEIPLARVKSPQFSALAVPKAVAFDRWRVRYYYRNTRIGRKILYTPLQDFRQTIVFSVHLDEDIFVYMDGRTYPACSPHFRVEIPFPSIEGIPARTVKYDVSRLREIKYSSIMSSSTLDEFRRLYREGVEAVQRELDAQSLEEMEEY